MIRINCEDVMRVFGHLPAITATDSRQRLAGGGLTMNRITTMPYTIDRTFGGLSFDEVEGRTRKALANAGFGVLTEIDVAATMQKKLGVTMPAYRILGACNPKMAHEAIGMEPRVGAMLPCNVILRAVEGGVEVSAIDPVASMQAIDNPALHAVAGQVRDLLMQAVAAI
jgi:uncharacterized protein (DUF302 family)